MRRINVNIIILTINRLPNTIQLFYFRTNGFGNIQTTASAQTLNKRTKTKSRMVERAASRRKNEWIFCYNGDLGRQYKFTVRRIFYGYLNNAVEQFVGTTT